MCLGVPMRVCSVEGSSARVELGGVVKEISTLLLPSAREGDFVIVHAGFAIERLDEQAARRTIAYLREMTDVQNAKNDGGRHA